MLEFFGIVFLIIIALVCYNILTSDESHFRITINDKDIIKYDKENKNEGEDDE